MSELVPPPKQAAKLQNALLDYLTTTFALSDADAQRALDEFLRDPDEGIFQGPLSAYPDALRTGTGALRRRRSTWMPEGFTPYVTPGHSLRPSQLGARTPTTHPRHHWHRVGQDRGLPAADP